MHVAMRPERHGEMLNDRKPVEAEAGANFRNKILLRNRLLLEQSSTVRTRFRKSKHRDSQILVPVSCLQIGKGLEEAAYAAIQTEVS